MDRILNTQSVPVDCVHVRLNGYTSLDQDLPRDDRIVYHLEPSNPGPWARYLAVEGLADTDTFATLDDDLDYPSDYIERGTRFLADRGESAAVSFGGIRWDCTADLRRLSFYRDRTFYGLTQPVNEEVRVALPLGALSFFRPAHLRNIIDIKLPGFRTNDDMMIGWGLQKQGVEIRCCSSRAGWVKLTEDSSKKNALAVRDKETRRLTFRALVHELGFDPTAGHLTEVLQARRRLLVFADVCPPLPGSEAAHAVLTGLCEEGTGVHVLAPVPNSMVAKVSQHAFAPYEVHPVAVPEPGGRFNDWSPIRAWRNWEVARSSNRIWMARVKLARARLMPTLEYRFEAGRLVSA